MKGELKVVLYKGAYWQGKEAWDLQFRFDDGSLWDDNRTYPTARHALAVALIYMEEYMGEYDFGGVEVVTEKE